MKVTIKTLKENMEIVARVGRVKLRQYGGDINFENQLTISGTSDPEQGVLIEDEVSNYVDKKLNVVAGNAMRFIFKYGKKVPC